VSGGILLVVTVGETYESTWGSSENKNGGKDEVFNSSG
jgi:hypothetical protein